MYRRGTYNAQQVFVRGTYNAQRVFESGLPATKIQSLSKHTSGNFFQKKSQAYAYNTLQQQVRSRSQKEPNFALSPFKFNYILNRSTDVAKSGHPSEVSFSYNTSSVNEDTKINDSRSPQKKLTTSENMSIDAMKSDYSIAVMIFNSIPIIKPSRQLNFTSTLSEPKVEATISLVRNMYQTLWPFDDITQTTNLDYSESLYSDTPYDALSEIEAVTHQSAEKSSSEQLGCDLKNCVIKLISTENDHSILEISIESLAFYIEFSKADKNTFILHNAMRVHRDPSKQLVFEVLSKQHRTILTNNLLALFENNHQNLPQFKAQPTFNLEGAEQQILTKMLSNCAHDPVSIVMAPESNPVINLPIWSKRSNYLSPETSPLTSWHKAFLFYASKLNKVKFNPLAIVNARQNISPLASGAVDGVRNHYCRPASPTSYRLTPTKLPFELSINASMSAILLPTRYLKSNPFLNSLYQHSLLYPLDYLGLSVGNSAKKASRIMPQTTLPYVLSPKTKQKKSPIISDEVVDGSVMFSVDGATPKAKETSRKKIRTKKIKHRLNPATTHYGLFQQKLTKASAINAADELFSVSGKRDEANIETSPSENKEQEVVIIYSSLGRKLNNKVFNDGYQTEDLFQNSSTSKLNPIQYAKPIELSQAMDSKHLDLIKTVGIDVSSPSGIPYKLVQKNKEKPKATLNKDDAEKIESETLEQHQKRLAITVMSMIDEVATKSLELHINTLDPFIEKIACEYIQLFEKSGVNFDKVNIKCSTISASQHEEATKIFNDFITLQSPQDWLERPAMQAMKTLRQDISLTAAEDLPSPNQYR